MIKVLVYGGEKNARRAAWFLGREMPLEIKCLTTEKDFLELSTAKIVKETDNALCPLIGRNEVIVLADPLDALATEEILKNRYPEQKFVGYGHGIARLIKRLKAVYVVVAQKIRRMEVYQRIKAECQQTEIRESDGWEWKELIENGTPGKEEIMEKVRSAQGAPIVVFHPEVPCFRMKEVVDWRNEVIDMEEELLKSVKVELGLKNWY